MKTNDRLSGEYIGGKNGERFCDIISCTIKTNCPFIKLGITCLKYKKLEVK